MVLVASSTNQITKDSYVLLYGLVYWLVTEFSSKTLCQNNLIFFRGEHIIGAKNLISSYIPSEPTCKRQDKLNQATDHTSCARPANN